MFKEKANPLGTVHFVKPIVLHDKTKKLIAEFKQTYDGHVLLQRHEIERTRSEWHVKDVNKTLDHSQLPHILLLKLQIAALSLKLIVVLKTVRRVHYKLSFFAVDFSLIVYLKPNDHFFDNPFNLGLSLFALPEVAV